MNTGPVSGSLFQLSHVYSQYGYEPKAGVNISRISEKVAITGSNNRVFYSRPSPDVAGIDAVSTCYFVVEVFC